MFQHFFHFFFHCTPHLSRMHWSLSCKCASSNIMNFKHNCYVTKKMVNIPQNLEHSIMLLTGHEKWPDNLRFTCQALPQPCVDIETTITKICNYLVMFKTLPQWWTDDYNFSKLLQGGASGIQGALRPILDLPARQIPGLSESIVILSGQSLIEKFMAWLSQWSLNCQSWQHTAVHGVAVESIVVESGQSLIARLSKNYG